MMAMMMLIIIIIVVMTMHCNDHIHSDDGGVFLLMCFGWSLFENATLVQRKSWHSNRSMAKDIS